MKSIFLGMSIGAIIGAVVCAIVGIVIGLVISALAMIFIGVLGAIGQAAAPLFVAFETTPLVAVNRLTTQGLDGMIPASFVQTVFSAAYIRNPEPTIGQALSGLEIISETVPLTAANALSTQGLDGMLFSAVGQAIFFGRSCSAADSLQAPKHKSPSEYLE